MHILISWHTHHTGAVHTSTSGALPSSAWNAGWLEVTGTDYVNTTCKLKSYCGMASIDLQDGKVSPECQVLEGNVCTIVAWSKCGCSILTALGHILHSSFFKSYFK